MFLKWCMKVMEYLHATLIFAAFIPLACAVCYTSDPAGTIVFYLKCLLIAAPIFVTDYAIRHTRSLFLYIFLCIVLFAAMGCVVSGFVYLTERNGEGGLYQICYNVGILVETIAVSIMRFSDRIKAAKRKREDPLAPEELGFLNLPALLHVRYFVVLYLIGICVTAKVLCDIMLFSAIVYTFLALVYEYVGAVGDYLSLNKRTKGISRHRIYGIGFSMLCAVSILLFMGMLPAIFLAGQRQYTDVRQWFGNMGPTPLAYEEMMNLQTPAIEGADIMVLLDGDEPPREPSKLLKVILYALEFGCTMVLACGVFCVIRQAFRDFRDSHDENGDIIEKLEPEKAFVKEEFFQKMGLRGIESEAQRIRRKYRKIIRKHRKDRPAPYESPIEIEVLAGLGEDEQMQKLHVQYEIVRYGK